MTAKVWLRTSITRGPAGGGQRGLRTAERQHQRHSASAGSGLPGGFRLDPAAFDGQLSGGAARDGARRPARRGRVPEGEDAQGRHRQPQRVRRSARPDSGRSAPARARTLNSQSSSQPESGRRPTIAIGTLGGGDDRRPPARRPHPIADLAVENRSTIPVGQEIDVRLQTELTSDTRAGRGSFRSHDRRRSLPRQRGPDSCRLGRARRRQLREQGDEDRPQGQPDRGVRPGDGQRPQLSDARHGDAGARERGHEGGDWPNRRRLRRSARSSAASSAV